MKYIGVKHSTIISQKMRAELVYNMSVAEHNPITLLEIDTLLEGISIGKRTIEDVDQVRRIIKAWEEVTNQVKSGSFEISKENYIKINKIVAENEALKVGAFRDSQVHISGVEFIPPPANKLDEKFDELLNNFNNFQDISHKSYSLFLDAARNQFFYDGNKRTAQLMMNGFLMSEGYSLVSIDPTLFEEYNPKLKRFYESGDKTEMIEFMGKCHAQKDLAFSDDFSEGKELTLGDLAKKYDSEYNLMEQLSRLGNK